MLSLRGSTVNCGSTGVSRRYRVCVIPTELVRTEKLSRNLTFLNTSLRSLDFSAGSLLFLHRQCNSEEVKH